MTILQVLTLGFTLPGSKQGNQLIKRYQSTLRKWAVMPRTFLPLFLSSSWSKSRHATLRSVMVFCLDALLFKWTNRNAGLDCATVSSLSACVCVLRCTKPRHRMLRPHGQTDSHRWREAGRQTQGEWSRATVDGVTDQDTSITICLLAASNVAPSSFWELAITVYWI